MRIQIQLRYVVFVPYLIYIGMMGGNIIIESIVIGVMLAMYDFLFDNDGGGRPAQMSENSEKN